MQTYNETLNLEVLAEVDTDGGTIEAVFVMGAGEAQYRAATLIERTILDAVVIDEAIDWVAQGYRYDQWASEMYERAKKAGAGQCAA